MDNNISFSKIVATPTLNSWSQAYNAGKLFAVLSLEKTEASTQELESLNILGKDLLERLEQEFFTIEEKNLESIKTAIANTFQNIPEAINLSFACGAFVNNILYVFGLGNGKAYIKRDEEVGLALGPSEDAKNVVASSGFVKDNDLIVLSTEAFSHVFSNDEISSNLNGLPTEISEFFAPKVHKSENGKISAIIIQYGKPLVEEVLDEGIETNEEIKQEDLPANALARNASRIDASGLHRQLQAEQLKDQISPFGKYLSILKSKLRRPNFKVALTRKVFLVLAIIIILVLASSIFLAIREQNNAKMHALFTKTYADAKIKYDEGKSLSDLNKNLARDSFLISQKILNDSKDKFPPKSKELVQIQDLSKKVESELAKYSPIDSSGLDRSKLSVTVENGSGVEGSAGKAADILKEIGYNVSSTGNADNYSYKGVTIKVKKEKSEFLDLLKKDLSKNYTVNAASSDLQPTSATDALIIIGK